jgi:putative membrane protein
MSDANILAVLHEANQGEIAAAQVALGASSNSRVKAFAHQMIRDHTKLEASADSLATEIGVTPTPPADDSLAAHGRQELETLRAAGSGVGFDKEYMDAQVADHATVLAMLQQCQGQAQNAQLKGAIGKAIPVVRGHLMYAKRLAATVGSSTIQSRGGGRRVSDVVLTMS